MFKSHTKLTTLNAHIIIIIIIITRSLVQHSLGLAHRYDPVIMLAFFQQYVIIVNLMNIKKYNLCSHLMNQTQVRLRVLLIRQ